MDGKRQTDTQEKQENHRKRQVRSETEREREIDREREEGTKRDMVTHAHKQVCTHTCKTLSLLLSSFLLPSLSLCPLFPLPSPLFPLPSISLSPLPSPLYPLYLSIILCT